MTAQTSRRIKALGRLWTLCRSAGDLIQGDSRDESEVTALLDVLQRFKSRPEGAKFSVVTETRFAPITALTVLRNEGEVLSAILTPLAIGNVVELSYRAVGELQRLEVLFRGELVVWDKAMLREKGAKPLLLIDRQVQAELRVMGLPSDRLTKEAKEVVMRAVEVLRDNPGMLVGEVVVKIFEELASSLRSD